MKFVVGQGHEACGWKGTRSWWWDRGMKMVVGQGNEGGSEAGSGKL